MARFFIDSDSVINDEQIRITGDDARHIGYSLRMRKGDDIIFCREGTEYISKISEITSDSVLCSIISTQPTDSEPDVRVTLYQALPKSDKMELIIQKTTELGIARIVPFISKRCISRPDDKQAQKKLVRWQKIAEEASKQSGRGIVPEISHIMNFGEMLRDNDSEKKLICYENGGDRLSEVMKTDTKFKTISVIIGAEGGFEYSEVEKAVEIGAEKVWLGKRILRCETCPIAVTSIIMNLTDNM